MRRFLPYRVLSRFLGFLLLSAAGVKLYGLAVEPVASLGVFSAPEFRIGVVQFEVVLGLWLMWGAFPVGAWVASLAGFGGFAAVSLYMAWIGQASCGCFGRLAVHPWYTFGFDVLVLTALLLRRPERKPFASPAPELVTRSSRASLLRSCCRVILPACTGVGAAILLLASSGLWVVYQFGSPEAALAYLRGQSVSVQPSMLNLGEGFSGEVQEGSIEVANWSDHPIRLIGGTSDCSCVVSEDLPLTIPPRQSRRVSVRMRLPDVRGIFSRSAVLLTDDAQTRRIAFRLTGRILRASNDSIKSE
jgi:hypothetical protein